MRTRTPSDVLADAQVAPGRLERLHSGSWIDADFRIWIGHPEKNRAWDLIARARRALVERGGPERLPEAWESLYRAEGSDWFWWFGEDHYTADKAIFDQLFRDHLKSVYTSSGATPPATLDMPIASTLARTGAHRRPSGLVRPVIDGRQTQYFEWDGAGRIRLVDGGGAMHRGEGLVRELHYGFDLTHLHLRLDFIDEPPGADVDLLVELHDPTATRVHVAGLAAGTPSVAIEREGATGPAPGASCRIDRLLELTVPFEALGIVAGGPVELLLQLVRRGQPIETIPHEPLRFEAPDATFERVMWDV